MYIKVVDDQVEKYPYTLEELRLENPNTSFPVDIEFNAQLLSDFGVYQVQSAMPPAYDESIQRVVEVTPTRVNSKWTVTYEVVSLKDREKEQALATKSDEVRSRRNILLAESDWTQLPDAPADATAWAVYRQELRDITIQSGYPFNVIWPTKPE